MRRISLASVTARWALCLAADDVVKLTKQTQSRLKTLDECRFAFGLLNSATDATATFITAAKENRVDGQEPHVSLLLFSHFPSFCCCVIIFDSPPPCSTALSSIFFLLFFHNFPPTCGSPLLPLLLHAPPSRTAGRGCTAVWAAATEIQCVSKSLSKKMDVSPLDCCCTPRSASGTVTIPQGS